MKKKSCQLCNKQFDCPSTLKKVGSCVLIANQIQNAHSEISNSICWSTQAKKVRQLFLTPLSSPPSHVHPAVNVKSVITPTAWACEVCARRFSISSNLNRHTRRCREKWAKTNSLATDTPSSSPSSDPSESPPASSTSSDSPDFDHPPSPRLPDRPKRRKSAPTGLVQYKTDDGSHSHDHRHVARKPHRRRRKGSPSEPWIPASLVNFNLQPVTRSILPIPLPAAIPSKFEERNSYADTPPEPYHPSYWTGSLVGPSYLPRSEEVSRGRFYGKLLVF